MEYSSTGINSLKPGNPKESLFFNNNECPHCSGTLVLDRKNSKNNTYVNIRYKCTNCGFVCPIYHSENNPLEISPLYDSSVEDFISSFGSKTLSSLSRNNSTTNNISGAFVQRSGEK